MQSPLCYQKNNELPHTSFQQVGFPHFTFAVIHLASGNPATAVALAAVIEARNVKAINCANNSLGTTRCAACSTGAAGFTKYPRIRFYFICYGRHCLAQYAPIGVLIVGALIKAREHAVTFTVGVKNTNWLVGRGAVCIGLAVTFSSEIYVGTRPLMVLQTSTRTL